MKLLVDKLNAFVAWVRARPMKVLGIFLAIETLVFLCLLVLLVWVLLSR